MTDIVIDPQLVRDYLAGSLSDVATRDLESRISRDPALVRTLEELLRFREGLEILRDRGEIAALLAPRPRPWLRWVLPLGAAAAIAAAVLIAILPQPALMSAELAGLRLPGSAPHQIVANYSLAAARQGIPTLDLPAAGPIQIRVLVTGAAGTEYRVTLQRRDASGGSSSIGAVSGLRPDTAGFVTVYADAARLAPGDYSVSATAKTAEVEVPFRLTRPAGGSATD